MNTGDFYAFYETLTGYLSRVLFAVPRSDEEYHTSCPKCGKPAKPKQTHFSFWSINRRHNRPGFKCHVCDYGGDPIKLARDLGVWDDFRRGNNTPSINTLTAFAAHNIATEPELPRWHADRYKLLQRYSNNSYTIGGWQTYAPLSEASIKRFKLGYGKLPGQKTSRLIVPIIQNGDIIGFRGRLPGSSNPFHKKLPKWIAAKGTRSSLFNIDEIQAGGILVISENNIESILMMQQYPEIAGLPLAAVSPTTGAASWQYQWTDAIQQKRPALIVLIYDNDKAGREATHKRLDMFRAAGLPVVAWQWTFDNRASKDLGDLLKREIVFGRDSGLSAFITDSLQNIASVGAQQAAPSPATPVHPDKRTRLIASLHGVPGDNEIIRRNLPTSLRRVSIWNAAYQAQYRDKQQSIVGTPFMASATTNNGTPMQNGNTESTARTRLIASLHQFSGDNGVRTRQAVSLQYEYDTPYHFPQGTPDLLRDLFVQIKQIAPKASRYHRDHAPAAIIYEIYNLAVNYGIFAPDAILTKKDFKEAARQLEMNPTDHTIRTGLEQLVGLGFLEISDNLEAFQGDVEKSVPGIYRDQYKGTESTTSPDSDGEAKSPRQGTASYYRMRPLHEALEIAIHRLSLAAWQAVHADQTEAELSEWLDDEIILEHLPEVDTTTREQRLTAREYHRVCIRISKHLDLEQLLKGRSTPLAHDREITNGKSYRVVYYRGDVMHNGGRDISRDDVCKKYGVSNGALSGLREDAGIIAHAQYLERELSLSGGPLAEQIEQKSGKAAGRDYGRYLMIGSKRQGITPHNYGQVVKLAEAALHVGTPVKLLIQTVSREELATEEEQKELEYRREIRRYWKEQEQMNTPQPEPIEDDDGKEENTGAEPDLRPPPCPEVALSDRPTRQWIIDQLWLRRDILLPAAEHDEQLRERLIEYGLIRRDE